MNKQYIAQIWATNVIKRLQLHILAIGWTLLLLVQLFVYNFHLREKLFGINSVVEMTASTLNDLIWIPVAIALPLYIARLAKRRFHLRQRYSLPVAYLIVILGVLNLSLYFKFLFILIFLYVFLFTITAMRYVSINYSIIYFTFCLVYVMMHYSAQLFPQILSHHSPATQIKLLTYNVKVDQQPFEHARILEYIEKEQPDIVCLQELSTDIRTMLEEHFSDTFKYMQFSALWGDYHAVAILSKIPITKHEIIKIHTTASQAVNNLQYVELDVQGTPLHLYNTHLYHGGNNIKRAILGNDVMTSLQRAGKAYERHRQEADNIFAFIRNQEEPIILAADLNDTPNSAVYHHFTSHFKNAFAQKGWGLGTTYGRWTLLDNIPKFWRFLLFDFLRIDHVFVSHSIVVHSARVCLFDASDHRPLMVIFSL